MPQFKIVTFNRKDKARKPSVETVDGRACRLYIGNIQHRFFIHRDDLDGPVLSDERSGMRVGKLEPIKVRHFRSYYTMTDRAAAEILIADIVARHGAESVRSKINAAPAIAELESTNT